MTARIRLFKVKLKAWQVLVCCCLEHAEADGWQHILQGRHASGLPLCPLSPTKSGGDTGVSAALCRSSRRCPATPRTTQASH